MAPPNALSCFPVKLESYAIDPQFREGWTTLTDFHRRGVLSWRKLWALDSVLHKAGAVLRGNGLQGLRLLEANGFARRAVRAVSFSDVRAHELIPVCARRIQMTLEQTALMWRYQANVMTARHFLLLQPLLAAGPSIYIALKDNSARNVRTGAIKSD